MNKALFKWHSRFALFAFLPLLVICVTGSVLVFKHEIDAWLMPESVRVDAAGAERLGLDALRRQVDAQVPGHEIAGWALFRDRERADLLYVIAHGSDEWQYILLNQYTGDLLKGPVMLDDHLTDWLLALHYTFLLDDAGLAITSVFAVLLCLLGITGLVLHRKFWKRFFTLRWNARLVVYFSDLHKMVGVIASPILLVLGFTGGFWNIQHLIGEYQEHADGHEHHVMAGRLYNDDLSVQALHDRAMARIDGFTPTYITFPYEPDVNFRFFGEVPDGNPLISQYASRVIFHNQTGEFLSSADIREAGVGVRVLDTFRRLHFGDFAGIGSRITWAVIGLMPLLLTITGLTLWSIRRRKIRAVQQKRALKAALESP
ncbi:MAG: PepSY-associated TM helix domain-containing protein [Alcanivoracaceae bacterium]